MKSKQAIVVVRLWMPAGTPETDRKAYRREWMRQWRERQRSIATLSSAA